MRRAIIILPAVLGIPLLGGCIAKTALDVVTLPVRAASGAVDLATTSQSEADEKRGRELRKREEALGKLERRYYEQRADCVDGDRKACVQSRETYADIRDLLPSVPAEPD